MIIKEPGLTHIKNGYGTIALCSKVRGDTVYLSVEQHKAELIGSKTVGLWRPEVLISFNNLNSIDVWIGQLTKMRKLLEDK